MTKEEKLAALGDAFVLSDNKYILNVYAPEEVKEKMIAVRSALSIHDRSLFNEIASDAAFQMHEEATISEIEYEEDWQNWLDDHGSEHASLYTADRLGYLSFYNQEEVSEFVHDYECDIQEGCALWYDEQVRQAMNQLRDWINE